MENKFKIVHYKESGFKIELEVLGFPPTNNALANNIKNMRANNPYIFNKETLIFMPISKEYKHIFKHSIYDMYLLRKTHLNIKSLPLQEFIYKLYLEYQHWLIILLEAKEIGQSKWTTEDHKNFLLHYNERYFPRFVQNRVLQKNIFHINPFIQYWYLCFPLIKLLDLPLNSHFIPCGYDNHDDNLNTLFRNIIC